MSSTAPSTAASANRRPHRAPRGRLLALGAVAITLLLAACGSSDGGSLGGKVAKDGLGCTVSQVDRKTTDVPVVKAGTKAGKATTETTVTAAPKGACTADSTMYLTVDVVGATAKDGKDFTNTFTTDRPLTVRLGQNQLIAGLETGLTGMKVGERRQIVIPAAEAYGKDGNAAQGIGADEDLVFIADLISLTDTPTYCNAVTTVPAGTREGKPTQVKMPVKAPTDKVVTTVLVPGDGPKATKKSYLTVDYAGFSCASGQQFDSSWDRADPITIAMADATPTDTAFSVIPGWTEGLNGQAQGSTVQVDIPFEDGYGTAGSPPSIGPSDPLTFIVKIIKVSDTPPASTTTTTTPAGAETTTTASAG
ncbi:FKBP-type peptidyl-prolyl cis-trans isomerase [Aquihabitans sp. McL0605]|uniref:FKBP-type peptidyl-prolyl cis-trans isomerase n=1 Tax=Aquihabitans sp. McL0605 TaxID=3415671 RepID=UPI003CF18CBE